MKMTKEHYAEICEALDKLNEEYSLKDAEAKYMEAGLTPKRFRWDAMYAISRKAGPVRFDPLYEYLNDDHIDTALRKYFGHTK